MKRREYILHLIGEVAHYILDGDPMRMVISLHQEEDGLHLAVIDSVVRSEEKLAQMRSELNNARRPELAGYYGSMAGSDMLGAARLSLIGWQVKHGDVTATSSGTKIDLWLGGDRFDPGRFSIPGSSDDTKS